MKTLTIPFGLLFLCAASVACGTDSGDLENSAPPKVHLDAGAPDTRIAVAPNASQGDPVAPVPLVDDACAVGAPSACMCPGGLPGTRTCIGNGQWSECGCMSVSGPDVFVAPKPPVILTCGTTMCAPYEEEETSVSARACCTTNKACGSSSDFIFGAACVGRGGDPGVPSEKCPDEAPNFLDIYGCCRTDGVCGLSIDHVANFDLGCVERTEMSALLNAGSGQRDFLSLIFLLPNPKTAFARIQCK
jgi:hypothetical protein